LRIKSKLLFWSISICVLICPGCKNQNRSSVDRPNFLLMLADDQRYNTISALGNHEIATPALDELTNHGLTFTHAHIMGGSSGAVCMPSRAMLLTSKSLHRLKRQGSTIPLDHLMFPEYFRSNGYETFGTGKWHNGKEAFARCFSDGGAIFFGGMCDHDQVPIFDFDPSGNYPDSLRYISSTFSSELFADEAIRFMQNHDPDIPFFAYIAFTAPHDPRMAPEEYSAQYTSDRVSVPENFLPQHPFDNGELVIRDERLAPFPRTPETTVEHLSAYYAMIAHLDFHIGRIVDSLRLSKGHKKTYVIFTADNGLAIGSHGLMGKQNLYDHSVRIPLIISGPRIGHGNASTLCYLNDLFPTLCDLAKLPIPNGIEGKSLLPAIESTDVQVHDYAYYSYRHLQRGIRTNGNWKLIRYQVNGFDTLQLFNLNVDPFEINNLALLPEYQNSVRDLTHLLHNAMVFFGDTLLTSW